MEFIPDDVSKTICINGQYDWTFKKVEGTWKVTYVKLWVWIAIQGIKETLTNGTIDHHSQRYNADVSPLELF